MNQPLATRAPFETTDLMPASFLRCRSFMIEAIKRQHGETIFAFDDSARLRQSLLDYAKDGAAAVRSFCFTMRDPKAITR